MEVLDKLIEYMGTHSVAFVIAALVIYGLWRGMNIGFTILEDKYKKKKHDKAVDKRNTVSPLLEEYLKDLRLELHVCRAYIFEFHNGTQSIGGLPFLFMSNTYESYDPRLSSGKGSRQHMPFTMYHSFLTALQHDKTVYLDVDKRQANIDGIVYETLVTMNVKKCVRTRITDRHGRIVGFVGVDYCEQCESVIDQVRIQHTIAKLEDMAPRLSEYLVMDK